MLLPLRILLAVSLSIVSMKTFAAEAAARGHSVPVNGMEMYYEEQGSGKPLVLLHGFGGCGKNWAPFAGKLSEHNRLIIVDMRGHGRSTNPENKFTHRQSANDVLSLLDSIGIDRFSAMGASSGGMTLLHMAALQPARVESMVLISAASHFPDQARSILRETSAENMPPEVQEMYRECASRGDMQIRQLATQFNGFHKSYDDMDFTDENLSRIPVQTLIVHGDRDPFFPVEIPVSIFRAMPNASLWIVPGGDHVPIYDPAVPFTATALLFFNGASSK
jgi:pimeloyl-ACP methyl ester carboxylesterase